MAATLHRAERSSAPPADASSAAPTADVDRDEPSAVTEAVFRAIADGRSRRHDDIARLLVPPVPPDRIVAEIERLQRHGMSIDVAAGTVVGAPFVPLDRAALMRALARESGAFAGAAWDAEVVFATRSTNSDLLAAVRARPPLGPRLRAAELQSAGRGRLGRRWSSAPGLSLTASFALTVPRPLAALDGATLVCGLAVHAVLADLGVDAQLKWPNDVLVDGAKLAGILVEANAAGASSILVVGIGVNVAGNATVDDRTAGPGALRRTTLAAAGATGVDRNLLAARLARSLEAHLDAFGNAGFGGFVARWNAVDAFAGRAVVLDGDPVGRRIGVAHGIDDRGALLVDVDGRRTRVVAGDVSLRPAAPDEASP